MGKLGSMLAVAGLLAAPQWAAASTVFFSPDSATATNTNATGGPENLVDLTGISSTPVTLANIGTISHSDAVGGELWRGELGALPITLTFEFLSPQAIRYVGMWQGYSEREGTGDFDLRFWDGSNGTGNEIGAVYSDALDTDAVGFGGISLFGRSFDVGLREDVLSMTMQINSNAVPFLPWVHLGEVMVAVPEPSTYISLFGLAMCGLYVQRRRRKS